MATAFHISLMLTFLSTSYATYLCSFGILQMRKERAQSEILLQGERGRLSAAEVRITELQGALAQREQELHAQKLQYDADVSALQQSLSKAHEREKYLKELNTEAYQLLEMYGANKIVM